MNAIDAAVDGGRHRLRPILMTSWAMIAGMVPMALALGEGGEQTASLGRAVIGGLAVATLATVERNEKSGSFGGRRRNYWVPTRPVSMWLPVPTIRG